MTALHSNRLPRSGQTDLETFAFASGDGVASRHYPITAIRTEVNVILLAPSSWIRIKHFSETRFQICCQSRTAELSGTDITHWSRASILTTIGCRSCDVILQSATWWFATKRRVRNKSAVNIKTDVDSMTTTVLSCASKNTLDCSKICFQHDTAFYHRNLVIEFQCRVISELS